MLNLYARFPAIKRPLHLVIFFLFVFCINSWGQSTGDFRSIASGDWSTSTTWERFNGSAWEASGIGANNPGNIPSASNNVFIQVGHSVSLSNNSGCNDLNLNNTSGQNRLALGVYTLGVNGRLRTYTGAAGTIPGTSGTPPVTANWITSTTGKLSIVGNTRVITAVGEWDAGNAGTTSPNGFDFEVNLNAGQTAYANTSIKARTFNIVTGTLQVYNAGRLAPDQGVFSGSDFSIQNNATVISNATGTAGSAVIGRTTNTTSGFGGTLTVASGGNLILRGALPRVAMSTITLNGTVSYDTTINQTLLQATNGGTVPNTYTNLVLGGSGTKTILSTQLTSASGTVSITGAASFVTNSKLSLRTTARIAPITSTANALSVLTGDVTVERSISSANNRAYRLLTPSVTTTTTIKVNWQEGATSNASDPNPGYGTHITGTTADQTNGFDATATGQPSLYTYDQVSTQQAWLPVNNTDINTLNAKIGYLIFIRGDRTQSNITTANGSTNTILRATGPLLVGDQTYTGLESNGRFSLVTNPYASPINWNSIYSDPSNNPNFENYYTYWDPNVGSRGTYVTVTAAGVNSVGSNGTVEIQQGQAFFVKTLAGVTSPTLTIKEAHKSSGANTDVFRVGAPETFRIRLYYNDVSRSARRLADGVVELFNNGYSVAVDGNDAEEIASFDENIAIARGGKMLSIEGRPLVDANDNIPLSISNLKQQQYEWQFDPKDFSAPNVLAYLQDKFLNTKTPISLATPTIISFTVTSDAASSAADRFTVVFAPTVALPISMTSVKAFQKTNGIQLEWKALNEVNIASYQIEKSINGTAFTAAASVLATTDNSASKTYNWYDGNPNAGNNFYRIRSVSKTGAVVYSEVVRISLGKGANLVSIYPNPMVGEVIGLQLTDLEKGKYTIRLINALGQQVYSKVIEHTGGSISETLQPGSALSKGIYQLQVKGEHTNITQQVTKQ